MRGGNASPGDTVADSSERTLDRSAPDRQQRGHVLDEHEVGLEFARDAYQIEKQPAALGVQSRLFACRRKVNTRGASEQHIGARQVVSAACRHVIEARHTRPMTCEHAAAVWIALDIEDHPPAVVCLGGKRHRAYA